MSERRHPFWSWRDDPYRFDDLDQYYDQLPDPSDDPASPVFDPLDVEPRIDCWWDELAEDRAARGLEG